MGWGRRQDDGSGVGLLDEEGVEPPAQAPVEPAVRRPRRGRAWVVNGVIVLALAVVAGLTYRAVRPAGADGTTTQQTATVDTGAVTATVTASGNVEAASTTDVSFATDGEVEAIYARVGETVAKGQRLARIDDTSARQTLSTAQAQLTSARASYLDTVGGLTAAEQRQNSASLAVSRRSVTSAAQQVSDARASYRLTRAQQDATVARAQAAWESAAAADRATTRAALLQARDTRASTLLQSRQSVASAASSLTTARLQYRSAAAQLAVSTEGPTDAEIAQAQASVTSARVAVDQAQDAVDDTVLRAPVAGTVTAVSGSVGASSGSSSSSSSSSASSTSSTSTSSSTSSGSGFVTLTSARLREVTAYVAEADIDDVEVGQTATVTLSASDEELTGEVTTVDAEPTVTNNVVEYGVTIRLRKAGGVRIGATSDLVITTGEKADVTRVSTAALTTVGTRTTATVLADDGTTSTVAVTTGLAGDSTTQVLSGLSPGDVVVVPQTDSDTGSTLTFPGVGGGGGGLGGGPGGP